MNTRSQMLCAWCGILCPLVMFAGLWPAAGFFPPPLPTTNAADIAAQYQGNLNGIRIGTILFLVAGALYAAFTAAVAAQMRRMETRETPVLTYAWLAGGISSILLFIIPGLIWTVAAFRPERNPEITQALNDIGWFFFVMPFVLGFLQNIVLGSAIVSEKSIGQVYPRWVGFFNFWIALLFVPGCLITFFQTGPFAWNGLLAFWVPAGIFGPWFFVVAIYTMKAIQQQAAGSK